MYHLAMLTPTNKVFEGEIESLLAPGKEGYLEVLSDHAPLMTLLQKGVIKVIDKEGQLWFYVLSGSGILEVSQNRAILLADTLVLKDDKHWDGA